MHFITIGNHQIISISLVFFCMFNIYAEDIIVLRTGDIIKANVLEIGQTEIKYKKITNLSGPTYSILKTNIHSINYENGEKDIFDSQINYSEHQSNQSRFIEPVATTDNQELIDYYNSSIMKHKKSLQQTINLLIM